MTDRIFNLQKHERRRFPRHFLNSVHCELGFAQLERETFFDGESRLSEHLRTLNFIESGSIHERELRFNTEGDNAPKVSEVPSERVGIHYKQDHPKRRIRFTADGLVLSDFSYGGFDEFNSELNEIIHAVRSVYGDLVLRKVGLRKINSLIAEPVDSYVDACSIFNPDVFGLLKSGIANPGTLKNSEEKMVLEKDHCAARLRLEFNQQEHPQKYEAKLDYDLVNKEERRIDECGAILGLMNQEHFDLFMWTVTDEMIALMEEGDHE